MVFLLFYYFLFACLFSISVSIHYYFLQHIHIFCIRSTIWGTILGVEKDLV